MKQFSSTYSINCIFEINFSKYMHVDTVMRAIFYVYFDIIFENYFALF